MKRIFLDLGKQSIANGFLKENEIENEYFYNLSIGFNEKIKLVSLMNFVDGTIMFNDSYVYHSSSSKTMRDHFKSVADMIKEHFNPNSILEIGSNDGVFLKHFHKKNVVAVEPCSNFAKITHKMGYKTYAEFWDKNLAEKIENKHGKMDLVYAANCICHIPNLDETFSAINNILNDDGIIIFEDPSLLEMLERNSYDQIYDEHAHIFSVLALNNILKKNGLEIFKVENIKPHGGSNRIFTKELLGRYDIDKSVNENIDLELKKGLDKFKTYEKFAERVQNSKQDLINLLKDLKAKGKKIISYGATSKSSIIFNFCEIDTKYIDYIIDTTPDKQEKLSPGMHIPVISPEEGLNETVDYAFLGAWNYEKEILNKEKNFIDRGGKFITHVPYVRILQ